MITKHPTSRTLIIHPLGDLDTLRSDHYRRQLRSLIDEGYRFLIFDLQDTPYINSSGLGLLIEMYNKTSRLEGTIKLINCSAQVQWTLEQTQLDRILTQSAEETHTQAAVLHYDSVYSYMSDELLLLAQVHEVTEKILALSDPHAIGELILKGIHQALRAQRSAFFLVSPDGRRLQLSSWLDGQEPPARPAVDEIELHPGQLATRLFEGNEVAWHELCDQDKIENNIFYRMRFDTTLAAPIRGQSRKFGLLVVEASAETMKILQSSRPIVRTFTNICGLAMEKTQLARQLQERSTELNQMNEKCQVCQQTLTEAGKLASLGVVMSGLGHLINNKMVPLLGYTQMLSQKKDLSQWVTEKVARIQNSGNEMNHIVDKLTRISRLHDRTNRPIDHAELIRTALGLLTAQSQSRDITVQVETTPTPPPVLGNPELLLQALLAILHRSLTSFDADNPACLVRITSETTDTGLRITITDNGVDFQDFDKDGWLDPIVPTEAMVGGMIFNYTIPRSILRKQRGTLVLEPLPGGGKRVVIDLPAAPAETPAPAIL